MAVAQQQLGDPVPGAHQVAADVFAGADQVAGGFLGDGGHPDAGDLADLQQLREQQCVPGVGLDSVTGGAGQLRRCGDLATDPGCGDRPLQPQPGRAGLVGGGDRAGQRSQPVDDDFAVGNQSLLEHLSGDAVQGGCHPVEA